MGYSGTNGLEQLKQLRNRKVARMNTLAGRRKQPVKDMIGLRAKIQPTTIEPADPKVLAAISEQSEKNRRNRAIKRISATLALAVVIFLITLLLTD